MLTLLSELKFLTTKDEICVKDNEFGAFKYHEKDPNKKDPDKLQACAKKDYAERRGLMWNIRNKQSQKLKNSLKQFEEELKHKKVVYLDWKDHKMIQLMLSNGLLIYIEVNNSTGDIKRINFDKYFVGKIIAETICDVVITRQHILISYKENQITFVYLQKPTLKSSGGAQKITLAEPKIFNIIIGGQPKKIQRNLVINPSNDLVLIWTKSSQNEFFPWRPTVRDQDRANIHIYKLNRLKLELLCYYWTENDPLSIVFSNFNQSEIHAVEQKISSKGDVTIENCTYILSANKSKLQRTSVTSIPLQTQVCCNAFSPDHEKLMMGCIDGSIVMFDKGRGITFLVKANFIPNHVSWHPDSALIMIANERCQLQCFDISLACVKSQLLSEDITPSNILDLSNFFNIQPTLLNIMWNKKPDINSHYERYAVTDCFLLLMFENGVFSTLRFIGGAGLRNDIHTSGLTADVLIHKYIDLNQVEKAINVLLNLNWDTYGAMCLLSLHKIANYIFKQPLTAEREMQLQKALGSFHVPVKPLFKETEMEFGDQVDDITRRFFHYLVKHKSFEKVFSLAIDINDADLFMNLHKIVKAHGLTEMAEEALKKSDEIHELEENESHHSTCSLTSCSICSGSEDSCSESESTEAEETEKNSEKPPIEEIEVPRLKENAKILLENQKTLRKSFSADLLNHPPLPRFPRYDAKKFNKGADPNYIPPLPFVGNPNQKVMEKKKEKSQKFQIPKPELRVASEKKGNGYKRRTGSMGNLGKPSELSVQNLAKYNYTSLDNIDGFNNNTSKPLSSLVYQRQPQRMSVAEIVPNPKMDIDQTIGIPISFESEFNGNQFFSSNSLQQPSTSNYFKAPEIKNDYEYHVPTTIHQYPLISGTIPSASTAMSSLSLSNQPKVSFPPQYSAQGPSNLKKKEATSSILSNNSSANNNTSSTSKKESGEKNKVKFSDTITVAVVPEIPRKEKFLNFNERIKREPIMHPMIPITDPRRELADSLPLCHPNEDYLKDFAPMPMEKSKEKEKNSSDQSKKSPNIKVVHFGVV